MCQDIKSDFSFTWCFCPCMLPGFTICLYLKRDLWSIIGTGKPWSDESLWQECTPLPWRAAREKHVSQHRSVSMSWGNWVASWERQWLVFVYITRKSRKPQSPTAIIIVTSNIIIRYKKDLRLIHCLEIWLSNSLAT